MKNKIILFLVIAAFQVNAQQFNSKIDSLVNKAVNLNRFNGTVFVSKMVKLFLKKDMDIRMLKSIF